MIIIIIISLYISICGMVICYHHGRNVGEQNGWDKGLRHLVTRLNAPTNIFKPLNQSVKKNRPSLWSQKENIRGEK